MPDTRYLPLASASEALPPLLDTALLIRALEGLEPSQSGRCPAHTTILAASRILLCPRRLGLAACRSFHPRPWNRSELGGFTHCQVERVRSSTAEASKLESAGLWVHGLRLQPECRDLRITNAARPVTVWICAALPALALLSTAAEPAPRDAQAEAAAYDRCTKLSKKNPAAAEKLAQTWHERGGAHPADHCAAIALIGLKQYKEAATRLEALAQVMTTVPAPLRAEVLDQAAQAWGLAGDPVRAY